MNVPDRFVEVSCDVSVALTQSKEVRVLSIERHGEWGDPDRYEVQTWGFEGRNGGHWVALVTSTASEVTSTASEDGTHSCRHFVLGRGVTARFEEEEARR